MRPNLYESSHQDPSFVRSTAVASTTFRRDLFLVLLNIYHTIPPIPTSKLASARFHALYFVSCVGIYPSTCPLHISLFWHRLLYRCYSYSRHIIKKERLVAGGHGHPGHSKLWRVGVRFAYPSRHQRFPHRCSARGYLVVSLFFVVGLCSTTSCLYPGIGYSYVVVVNVSPQDDSWIVEVVHHVALHYGCT